VNAATTRKKILAVDDDPQATGPLRQILTEKGYDVTVAASGAEALLVLAGEPFDLVLLDVSMPGLTGYEVCREIRQEARTKDLPVVFLTARSMGRDVAEGLEAGSDLYLVKPVLATRLLGMVESALSGEPRRRPGA
jgi:DNA-binding response OmpR family regulator